VRRSVELPRPEAPPGTGVQVQREGGVRDEAVDPYANPVYELLAQQLALSRTRLSALERQQAELASMGLDKRAAQRLAQLHAKRLELEGLETQFYTARDVYVQVSTHYEQAQARAANVHMPLRVLDPAIVPQRAIAPKTARNTVAGAVGAVGLAGVVVLLLAGVVSDRPRREDDDGNR